MEGQSAAWVSSVDFQHHELKREKPQPKGQGFKPTWGARLAVQPAQGLGMGGEQVLWLVER